MPFTPKKKRSLAIWRNAFPNQAKALRPENTRAGGVKARSGSEKVRMDIYMGVRAIYMELHPVCECCCKIHGHYATSIVLPAAATEIHHVAGRNGFLLFDPRNFKATCSKCHHWIGEHPMEAEKLGLIKKRI